MKTITIPKRFGYPTANIVINGKEETFRSGVEISVDDSIAEVIENALELEPKPKRYLSKIGQMAEGSLKELTSEDLEGSATIYTYAFYNAKNLTSVTLSDSIKSIGEFAFFGCSNIENIRFGDNIKLETIGANAFNWCAKLAELYLPETPPTLADINAFANIDKNCVFYCKTQESLDAYKAADNWSTLAGTYSFVVES